MSPHPRRQQRTSPTACSRGFGLIEALIAVLLLSMAALGYAKLQMRSMGSVSSSLWQSKAVFLAYSMQERMRANPVGWRSGFYDRLVAASPVSSPSCGSSIGAPCSPAQIATLDLVQWYQSVSSTMPAGTVAVCKDASPNDGSSDDPACDGSGEVYAVKVFWTERDQKLRLVHQLHR